MKPKPLNSECTCASKKRLAELEAELAQYKLALESLAGGIQNYMAKITRVNFPEKRLKEQRKELINEYLS